MKLKKFTKNKKQKQIVIGSIVGILLLIGGISLYRTFAMYKVEKTFDVLNGTVPDFSSGDVTLAFTINGNKIVGLPFPNKEDGYEVKEVKCEDGITANWDESKWGLVDIQNEKGNARIKCTINFDGYKEKILNGADPIVTEELVPIMFGDKGIVTKADINQKWYKYEDKEWANAVLLTEEGKKKNIEVGQTINESDIESYFVWIPKYKYQLFNMQKYTITESSSIDKGPTTPINIQFGLVDTKDNVNGECTTPNKSGDDGNCHDGNWMTHPAFTAFPNSKGFWIGKFETGYKDATSTTFTDSNKSFTDRKDTAQIVIKPNQYSWRFISLNNAYLNSFEYHKNLNSHLIKNTEWGAVAYLTQSVYGTCSGTSCKKIMLNNNSTLVTGYSAINNESTTYVIPTLDNEKSINYTNPMSVASSTTNNYSGVYDLSGGASEFTMAFSQKVLDTISPIDKKYYDLYEIGNNSTDYSKRILGDATGEMGPFSKEDEILGAWHKESSSFIAGNNTLFVRGGTTFRLKKAGIFAAYPWNVDSTWDVSFRIVLTP